MRAQIVLIGTRHSLQCGSAEYAPVHVDNFRLFVREQCLFHKVALIAEEMNCDGLSRYGTVTTVAAAVASELGIQHRNIDLTTVERMNLNIDDGSLASAAIRFGSGESMKYLREELNRRLSNPIRECYWLASMLAENSWPTLFICGADHVGNMSALIGSVGQDILVAHYDYQP